MYGGERIISETVDLTNCDKEPIHIPGSIQPHGILFVLAEPKLTILQVSNNTFEFIGVRPQDLLGRELTEFLPAPQVDLLRQALPDEPKKVNPLEILMETPDNVLIFNGIVHRNSDGSSILELERKQNESTLQVLRFYQVIKEGIPPLNAVENLQKLSQKVVQKFREIIGFDRVTVYQFNNDGSGTVIAEDKQENLAPFLGLHFPDSDIPKQAKRLYYLNCLRLIPDVDYQPVPLIPAINPVTEKSLDLSLSFLRSVSPIHLEYLQNMKVKASLSLSIIVNNKLWGLMACHHNSPKYLSYNLRTACEIFAQVVSLKITERLAKEASASNPKFQEINSEVFKAVAEMKNWVECLIAAELPLREMLGATGMAVQTSGKLIVFGKTPPKSNISELITWLYQNKNDNSVFFTDKLPHIYPAVNPYKEIASGLLVMFLSPSTNHCILWFRPETVETINWGGNPYKQAEVAEDGSWRLTPRKSFELWQETVRGKSLPWKQAEIDRALAFRSDILTILLQQAHIQQQQAERETLIGAIAQQISRTFNLEEVLNTTVQRVRQFMEADRVSIYRYSKDGTGEIIAESIVPGSTSILGRTFPDNYFTKNSTSSSPTSDIPVVEDIQVVGLTGYVELLAQLQIQANLMVPIYRGDKSWGLLIVHQCKSPRQWKLWEVELLEQLALQIAIALQQAEQYQQLQSELHKRQQAEAALRQANEQLERRVAERTAELQQSEQQLRQANVELKRSNEELEQFAYIASHDLQEPLRKIKSFIELLVEDYGNQLDAAADKYIGYIVDGATRMEKMINDLLIYSRVGSRELVLELTDLNVVLAQTLVDLDIAIAENHAAIATDFLPTVPANPQQMQQLFQNLIANAIKFRSEAPPEIRIQAKLQQREWLISVQDNGIGIKPKYAERIFTIFQRLHGRDKYPGTGIGLAICRKIVDRHQGRIWVESELGRGATFYFTLPRE